jgi:hypothetical protein
MTSTPPTTTSASTDFVFFEGAISENAARARITVRRGGLLILTAGAVAMLGEEVDTVQLAFSPTSGAVGIRAADSGIPGSYRLRPQINGTGRQVSGKRFFEHHGLDADQARTFEAINFGEGLIGFRFEVPAAVESAPEGDGQSAAEPKARLATKAAA